VRRKPMNTLSRSVALVGAVVLAGCAPQPAAEPPDTRAADEAAIHAAVKAWSAAAEAKDAETFASVYADDAVLMLEDAPDLSGLPALREGIGGMMQDPNFALSFAADKVVVARSGDIAYEVGTYSMTMSDPDGNPAPEKGSYVVVWQKGTDGQWKVVVDVPVSDPPEETATE
jgi:uncharacterized protein (TIGR02246 family)